MRRILAMAIIATGFAGPAALASGCSSFSAADSSTPTPGVDGAAPPPPPVDEGGLPDASGGDTFVPPPGPRFCDDKGSYDICSDYDGVSVGGRMAMLVRGWTSLDPAADVAIDLMPPVADVNRALHWKVPDLAANATDSQSLRKDLVGVPSMLAFGMTLRMGANTVNEYTQIFQLETPDDPRDIQLFVEMTNGGDLKLVETSLPLGGGPKQEQTLGLLGTVTSSKPHRIELRFVFGGTNTFQLVIDGVVQGPADPLKTANAPTGKPVGAVRLAVGYPSAVGASGKTGGGFYMDDITLNTAQ